MCLYGKYIELQESTTVSKPKQPKSDNPLELAKNFKQQIKTCCRNSKEGKPDAVTYLWICVSSEGIMHYKDEGAKQLGMEEWLNVVDEAASLGASWVVLTLSTRLSQHDGVWEICRWAQDAHGMMVGLHLAVEEVNEEELASIKSLDLSKVRILIRREALPALGYLEKEGIQLWTANPQSEGIKPHCQGPAKMIYVNANGMLYTCGLVDGIDQYHMGSVLEKKLRQIMQDKELPHSVEEGIHRISPACDGCPALVANFFSENF